jgi:hypothetical protein
MLDVKVFESIGVPAERLQDKKFFVTRSINHVVIDFFEDPKDVVRHLCNIIGNDLSGVDCQRIFDPNSLPSDMPADIEMPCYRLTANEKTKIFSAADPKLIGAMLDCANQNRGGNSFAFGELEGEVKINESAESEIQDDAA